MTEQIQNRELALHLLKTLAGLNKETGEKLLTEAGTLRNLARIPRSQLTNFNGIGNIDANKITAMTQWALLLQQPDPDDREQMDKPKRVADLLQLELRLLEQVEMHILITDNQNRLIKRVQLYKGNLDSAIVRTAEVFREAIILNAAGIIVAVNYPSATDARPHNDTIAIAQNIAKAGKHLDIKLTDFILFAGDYYTSFKEKAYI